MNIELHQNSKLSHQALNEEQQRYSDEAEHDDGSVHVADALEALEPVLAVPAESVQCAPETV